MLTNYPNRTKLPSLEDYLLPDPEDSSRLRAELHSNSIPTTSLATMVELKDELDLYWRVLLLDSDAFPIAQHPYL